MIAFLAGAVVATLLWLAVLREVVRRLGAEQARLRQEIRTSDRARDAMRERLAEAEQGFRLSAVKPRSTLPTDPELIRAEIDALTGQRTVFDDLENEGPEAYGL